LTVSKHRVLPRLRDHANEVSDLRLGWWWLLTLGVVTPVVLGWMMVDSLRTEFEAPYEDYPVDFLLVAGWGVAVGVLVVGVALAYLPSRRAGPFVSVTGEKGGD
jgi:neurotransmitter:Na+ symporter, NSS family